MIGKAKKAYEMANNNKEIWENCQASDVEKGLNMMSLLTKL